MRIGHKLLLGFTVIALLLAVVACVDYLSLSKINSELNKLESDVVPNVLGISDMENYSNSIAHGLMDYCVTGEEEDKDELQASMKSLEQSAKEHAEHEARIGPEEKKVAEELEANVERINSVVSEIINLKARGVSTEELLEQEKELHPVFHLLIEQAREHKAVHLTELAEAQKRASETQATATLIILFASIGLLVVALGLGFFISRSISRPISRLKVAADAVAGGEYGTQADVKSKDEVGDLAESFNKMSRELSEAVETEKQLAVAQAIAAAETERADELRTEIDQRMRAEEERDKVVHDLGERVKELDSLYGLSRLIERPGITLEEILWGTVELLSPSWQYPNITCARLVVGDLEFKTDNYRDSEWTMSADIVSHGEREGTLEVGYLEERPRAEEGPFLAEERNLIDRLAERLGRVIERMRGKQQLVAAKEMWERSFKDVGEGMFVIDKEFTVLQCNEAFGNLVGDKPDNLIGHKCYELVHNLDGPPDFCITNAAVIKDQSVRAELYEPSLGKYLEASTDPFFDPEDNFDFAIHLVRDITERKWAEEELQRINAELGGFAHTVSHDLRGPLTVITLASHNLRETLKSPQTDETGLGIEELVEIISSNVDISGVLIEDLLTLAESGQEPREVSDVDVGETVKRVLEERRETIEERGIKVNVDDNLGHVRANSTQVYQLFSNLIGNAIKHNDSKKPVIDVSYLGDDERGAHRYLVRDNGPGIPPEELDKIFTPFYKGKTGGTGIGLTTVDKIIKVYGGEIKAYNDNGACFEFTLKNYEEA